MSLTPHEQNSSHGFPSVSWASRKAKVPQSVERYKPGVADMILAADAAPAAKSFSSLDDYNAWVAGLPTD